MTHDIQFILTIQIEISKNNALSNNSKMFPPPVKQCFTRLRRYRDNPSVNKTINAA